MSNTNLPGQPGRARGRGRARALAAESELPPTGAAAATAAQQAVGSQSLILGAGGTATTAERPVRPAPLLMQTPRGRGIEQIQSGMAQMRIGEGGRSRGRGLTAEAPTMVLKPIGLEKRGTNGEPISLIANYVRLLASPQWTLFQYHIEFVPNEIESRRMKRELLVQHRGILRDVAFDGQQLFSFEDFGEEKEVTSRHPVSAQDIRIILRKVGTNAPESPQFFHLANLVVRKLLEMAGLKLIGRNYYQFDRKIELPHYRLTLYPGFITNVNIFEGQLMINVDLSHKVLNNVSVYQRLQDIFNQTQGDYVRAQDQAAREMVGQIVMTTYNNRTYRVDEIAWDKDPKFLFKKRDGTEIPLTQYYLERYQHKIQDEGQPLLISRPSKRDRRAGVTGPILLIPELCRETGISDAMRSDFGFMKEFASHTHIDPNTRYLRLQEFIADLNGNMEAQKELSKWQIQLDENLIEFQGRILDREQIHYADKSINYKTEEADWSRDGRSLKHISAKKLSNWIVLYTGKDAGTTEGFIEALNQVCTPFGMHLEYPEMIQLQNDRPESYLNALNTKVRINTDMVVCVLPNNRKDRYDALKKYLCLDVGVPSQMVLTKTLTKRNQLMSVATKIGIQMNAKLGGEIWGVTIPSKGLMVVGMDSYHEKRGPSVGAFVASINPGCTRFYSRVIYQKTTQELVDGITLCLRDSLQEYYKANSTLPDKIIIYRDGVGDGQLPVVAEQELPQILETMPKIMPDYDPKLAMVIVKKRGTSRFFAKNHRQLFNPPPGTIIDHTVTNVNWYDFYLISQCARQGTVAPTHFNVIWDRTSLKVDHMQRLTHKMCHMYYNWPGTIRVPAVCQYAHKLAYLVGQSLHQDFNRNLSDKLFYL